MSKKTNEHWTEERLNARLDVVQLMGEWRGLAEAANSLLDGAKFLFANGQDKEAQALRTESQNMQKLANEREKKWHDAKQKYERQYE